MAQLDYRKVGVLVAFIAVAGIVFASSIQEPDSASSDALDEFAQCLTENDATFYGLNTCSACKEQKQMFGDAMDHIDYVECSVYRYECKNNNIRKTPTWIIDGERYIGVQSFQALGDATGCEPPS